MNSITMGDFLTAGISGGTISVFAYAVWQEVKAMRAVLLVMNERIALLEERTRMGIQTPSHGIPLVRID